MNKHSIHGFSTRCLRESLQFLPLFSSILLFHRPATPYELQAFVKVLGLGFFLILGETLLLQLVLPYKIRQRKFNKAAPSQTPPRWYIFKLIFLSLIIIVALQLIRLSLAPTLFYLLLAVLFARSLQINATIRGQKIPQPLFSLLYLTLAGLFGLQILYPTMIIPALIFSLALAATITSVELAHQLKSQLATDTDAGPKHDSPSGTAPYPSLWLRRIMALCLVSGPILYSLLVFIGLLPIHHYCVALLLIPISYLVNRLKLREKNYFFPTSLTLWTTGACLAFLGMIVLLK